MEDTPSPLDVLLPGAGKGAEPPAATCSHLLASLLSQLLPTLRLKEAPAATKMLGSRYPTAWSSPEEHCMGGWRLESAQLYEIPLGDLGLIPPWDFPLLSTWNEHSQIHTPNNLVTAKLDSDTTEP